MVPDDVGRAAGPGVPAEPAPGGGGGGEPLPATPTVVQLTGAAGEAVSADREGATPRLEAKTGEQLVLTATTTPAKTAAQGVDAASWTFKGSPVTGGTASVTDTAWTYTVAELTTTQAGAWGVTVGGASAEIEVTVGGGGGGQQPPAAPPVVIEAGAGEYDPDYTKSAAIVSGVVAVVLGLAWWTVRDLVASTAVDTTAGGAVRVFGAVGLLAFAVAAVLALVAGFCGALEARARLTRPVPPPAPGGDEGLDGGGEAPRGGTEVSPWNDVIKAALEQIPVMRATVALLTVSAAIAITTVVASCQVATTAVQPTPSPSPSSTATPAAGSGATTTPTPSAPAESVPPASATPTPSGT